MGCYDFPGETWAGDGSAHEGVMGAGSVCFQQPGRTHEVRVGREEEGISSLRPELAGWIWSGSRTTLAGDANADIVASIVERVRARVLQGACTFMVKVKAHRGEPLNEKADTQAESARQLPSEHRQWTTRTQTVTYEWKDNDGVKHVTSWSKAFRSAMLRGGAEYQMQRALNRAVDNWIKSSCDPSIVDCKESNKQRIQKPKVT
jgi:hypothetical protein